MNEPNPNHIRAALGRALAEQTDKALRAEIRVIELEEVVAELRAKLDEAQEARMNANVEANEVAEKLARLKPTDPVAEFTNGLADTGMRVSGAAG
jgi:hypothetical protein